jgi:hypothetical protein
VAVPSASPLLRQPPLASALSTLPTPPPSSAHVAPSSFSIADVNPSCQVRRRPLLDWTHPVALPLHRRHRWFRRCRGLPGRIHVAAAFSARSAIPLAGSPSSWLDSSLPWPSRPDPTIPLLLCSGRGHPDRRRRVLPPASLAGLLDDRTTEVARRSLAWCSFVASPRRPLTLERQHPRRTRPQHCSTSTSATSASRGYHLHKVHTGLYSSHNVRTRTML